MTKFKDLAIGDYFKTPGGRQVYLKITGHSARTSGWRTKRKDVLVNAEANVVPEHTATTDDILNSWRHL